MRVTICTNTEHQLVNIVLEGTIDAQACRQIRADVLHTATEQGFYRLLFDVRKALIDLGTIDLFRFAFEAEADGMTRKYMSAVIYSGQDAYFNFYEIVSRNRGYFVRCFTDIKEAVDWLTQ